MTSCIFFLRPSWLFPVRQRGEATVTAQADEIQVVLDEEMARETVEPVADVVDREDFHGEVASRVKESLLEELERESFTAVESAENLALW